jgi:hypothetical protein
VTVAGARAGDDGGDGDVVVVPSIPLYLLYNHTPIYPLHPYTPVGLCNPPLYPPPVSLLVLPCIVINNDSAGIVSPYIYSYLIAVVAGA